MMRSRASFGPDFYKVYLNNSFISGITPPLFPGFTPWTYSTPCTLKVLL